MRTKTEELELDGTDMTSTILSESVWLENMANAAIQIVFTGTPNGTFKLQASCDEPSKNVPAKSTPQNWTDVVDSSQAVVAAGNHIYEMQNIGYTFVRVVWTDTSSGSPSTITSIRFMVKGV